MLKAVTYTGKGSTTSRSDREDVRTYVYVPEGLIGLEVWKTKHGKGETRVAITVNDQQTAWGSNTVLNCSLKELLAADFLTTGTNEEEQ